jgi:hypothetical protein
LQFEAGGGQRWPPVVGERPADGQAVAADGLSHGIGTPVQLPFTFKGTHAPHALLELLFGMPVGLEDGPGGFPQVMKLTEVVRHAGQGAGDRLAQRVRPVGDPGLDGDSRAVAVSARERVADLLHQRHQVAFSRAQEAAGQQHLPGAHVAQHPQDFMAHIRLQAVNCADDAALLGQTLAQPRCIASASRRATSSS